MRTNKEKWDHWLSILDSRAVEDIHDDLPILPDIIYKVRYDGEIEEYKNDGLKYRFGFYCPTPTRKDVLDIKEIAENEYKFEISKYYIKLSSDKCYTSVKLTDIIEKKDVFMTIEEAEIVSTKRVLIDTNRKAFAKQHAKPDNYNYHANGYRFLDWMNGWSVYPPEYKKCRDQNHQLIEVSKNSRGTEHVVDCPLCKIFWKYDSSD